MQHFKDVFGVVGDPHILSPDHRNSKLLEARVNFLNQIKHLKFVLVTGDIAHQGKSSQLIEAKRILDKLKVGYHCCVGNHDCLQGGVLRYRSVFGPEEYVSKVGNFNLLVLDNAATLEDTERYSKMIDLEKLIKHLESNPALEIDPRLQSIVLIHRALDEDTWSSGCPKLEDFFKARNVVCVFQGHIHKLGHREIVHRGVKYINCPGTSLLGLGALHESVSFKPLTRVSRECLPKWVEMGGIENQGLENVAEK